MSNTKIFITVASIIAAIVLFLSLYKFDEYECEVEITYCYGKVDTATVITSFPNSFEIEEYRVAIPKLTNTGREIARNVCDYRVISSTKINDK